MELPLAVQSAQYSLFEILRDANEGRCHGTQHWLISVCCCKMNPAAPPHGLSQPPPQQPSQPAPDWEAFGATVVAQLAQLGEKLDLANTRLARMEAEVQDLRRAAPPPPPSLPLPTGLVRGRSIGSISADGAHRGGLGGGDLGSSPSVAPVTVPVPVPVPGQELGARRHHARP